MAWITLQEGARRLDGAVSVETLRKLAHAGKIKATRVGRIIIDDADLARYVREQGWALITPTKPRHPPKRGGKRKAA